MEIPTFCFHLLHFRLSNSQRRVLCELSKKYGHAVSVYDKKQLQCLVCMYVYFIIAKMTK